MLVLKMLEDRSLVITKSGNTYQDENNAETIKIILPKSVNNNDLKDCHIYLSFINQSNLGGTYDLTECLRDYSSSNYVAEFLMSQVFTYKPGTISMWIKVVHSPTEMVAKTNEVSYSIKTHRETEDTIPEPEKEIIDGLVIEIDKLSDKVDEVISNVNQLSPEGYDVMLVKSEDE